MKVFLLTIVLIGLAVAAIAIKMFMKKDGEFVKSCSHVDPHTDERIGCVCNGAGDGDKEKCEYYEQHHGKELSQ